MMLKVQIINIISKKEKLHKQFIYPARIADWKWCSKEVDIIWRNKITNFKEKIKKLDESSFVALNYHDVWHLLEEELIE